MKVAADRLRRRAEIGVCASMARRRLKRIAKRALSQVAPPKNGVARRAGAGARGGGAAAPVRRPAAVRGPAGAAGWSGPRACGACAGAGGSAARPGRGGGGGRGPRAGRARARARRRRPAAVRRPSRRALIAVEEPDKIRQLFADDPVACASSTASPKAWRPSRCAPVTAYPGPSTTRRASARVAASIGRPTCEPK